MYACCSCLSDHVSLCVLYVSILSVCIMFVHVCCVCLIMSVHICVMSVCIMSVHLSVSCLSMCVVHVGLSVSCLSTCVCVCIMSVHVCHVCLSVHVCHVCLSVSCLSRVCLSVSCLSTYDASVCLYHVCPCVSCLSVSCLSTSAASVCLYHVCPCVVSVCHVLHTSVTSVRSQSAVCLIRIPLRRSPLSPHMSTITQSIIIPVCTPTPNSHPKTYNSPPVGTKRQRSNSCRSWRRRYEALSFAIDIIKDDIPTNRVENDLLVHVMDV